MPCSLGPDRLNLLTAFIAGVDANGFVPALLGAQFITGIVNEYPECLSQFSATCLFLDRAVNLMDEGVDVAVRIGEPPGASMRAVNVGQVRRVICAAPNYLACHGTPQHPEVLIQHSVVAAAGAATTVE